MASTPSPGGSETWPSSPSGASGAQSAKAKRYDRQLRLWGDHGQLALERARVCVINATATATEVLKALVLPGVGHFTIVDGHKISGEDVGNNFFLDKGKSKERGPLFSPFFIIFFFMYKIESYQIVILSSVRNIVSYVIISCVF